jgi:hypothetical protein
MSAGFIEPGASVVPRRKKFSHTTGTLLSDGRLDVAGVVYSTPSEAAKAIVGKATNGWAFFIVDQRTKQSLRDVRRDYLESLADDRDDDDVDEDVDDES